MRKKSLFILGSFCLFLATLRCGNTTTTSQSDGNALITEITQSILTFSKVTSTSITVNWSAPTSASFSSTQLSYLLFYTTKNPGTGAIDPSTLTTSTTWAPVGKAAIGITSASLTELTPYKLYYFSLLVTNSAKNKAVYKTSSQKTLAAEVPTTTLSSLLPDAGLINPTPTTIIATFSAAMMPLTTSDFTLSGTCTTLPTAGMVTMSSDATSASLSLAGGICTDTQTLVVSVDATAVKDANGIIGTGSALSNIYTVSTTGPSAALGTPSSTDFNSTGTSTLAVTYTDSPSGASALSESPLTTEGGGVTLTPITGAPSCTVTVSNITTTGATIALSSCSGSGTLTAHVNAATVVDPLGNPSTVSSESAVITIDNTAPTLLTLTPATSYVNPTPSSVVATFSKAMTEFSASHFTLGGTCTTLPTKGSVTRSVGNTVATLTLSGGSCSNTQTLTVSVDPTTSADTLGNAGTGAATLHTYTVSDIGPSATLGGPSIAGGYTKVNSTGSVTVPLTYTPSSLGGTTLTTGDGALTTGGGGVTPSFTGGASCSIAVSAITTAGATLILSSCTGNGTATVHVNAGTVEDAARNLSTVSGESASISIDNTAPTLSSTTPATSTISAIPGTIVLTFSEAVTAVAGNFTVSSSTCSPQPTLSSISGSGTSNITVNLTGGTCTNGQTIVLTSTLSAIHDLAGNAGVAENTVTLTYASTPLYLFASATAHNGNLGGRGGADTICDTTRNASYSSICTSSSHVHAVLSTSSFDTMAAMQTTYGFSSSAAIWDIASTYLINSNWSDLISNGPCSGGNGGGGSTCGSQAINTVLSIGNFWTGSSTAGALSSRNCSAWTTGSSTPSGNAQFGNMANASINASWISSGYWSGCSGTAKLLCVCW